MLQRNTKSCFLLAFTLIVGMTVSAASGVASDNKPYDRKLMRLSEILGAIHYLRELCGANEGQIWRDRMQALLKSEGRTAVRRAMFAQKFNQGYQSYNRTYKSCTPTAKTAVGKFMSEGATLSAELVKSIP